MTTERRYRAFYRTKRFLVPFLIVVGLIAFRLYLPTLIKNYMNRTLANDLPGYYGQVADVDLSLWRGAYALDGLYINKLDAQTQVPFVNFPRTDISIQWRPLLRGRVVAKVAMTNPEIIYVAEDQETEAEADVDDWTTALTDLIPIDINRLDISGGKLAYVEVTTEPNIDLQISGIDGSAENLSNARAEARTLPSPIAFTGTSIGGGSVDFRGRTNLLKEIPDFDLAFKLENADMTAFNNFTEHYAKIDFTAGTFNVFSELAIADGFLKGYVKPFLDDTKLINEEDSFLEKLWEGLVSFFRFVVKNHKTGSVAMRVPLEGDLNNVEAGVWPTVKSIFRNGWIEAFKQEVDDNVEYEDAFEEAADGDEMTRKEKRQERREERRQIREERREERKADD